MIFSYMTILNRDIYSDPNHRIIHGSVYLVLKDPYFLRECTIIYNEPYSTAHLLINILDLFKFPYTFSFKNPAQNFAWGFSEHDLGTENFLSYMCDLYV